MLSKPIKTMTKTFISRSLFMGTFCAVLLAGCASQGVLIGDRPTDPPPQIVFLGARDAANKDYLTWENVTSFGRVPSDLQAVGDLSCMRVDLALRATGYHPQALDRQGKSIPGGGYFCQLNLSAQLNPLPPRLVINGGLLGWDRPGAFGPVPVSLAERAQRECSQKGSSMRPLGYHPRPLDLKGQTVPEGGFLCVE